MFDLIAYAKEQLAIRGKKAQYMEHKTLVFPDSSWLLEIDAYNGTVFFQNPMDFPEGTIIMGDNNAIRIDQWLTNENSPYRIEEFSGQVTVELTSSPERQPIVQYLQVYYA